jgi:hypothetical protein
MHPRRCNRNPIAWKQEEIPIMKSAMGVLAVMLLVSALAVGQSYQPLPFPQEANTALQGGLYEESVPSATADMPSSMAADQSNEITPSYRYEERSDQALGSPFPQAANPSLGHHGDEMAPTWTEQRDLGSPFPSDANPSHE